MLYFSVLKIQMNKSKNKYLPDSQDNNPKTIPGAAREMPAFFSFIVEETMKTMHDELTPTWIRCIRKGCSGIIPPQLTLMKMYFA
jgi:hypothetical protein